MIRQPFNPYYGSTITLVTAASAAAGTVRASAKQLLIVNDGTGIVFVRVNPAGTTTAATAADLPVLSKTARIVTKDGGYDDGSALGQTSVSVFSPGGAVGNVYITPGEGGI